MQIAPPTLLALELVASAQIRGGTRVIVMTAREPLPHHYVVETTAYDSNHPGQSLGQATYSGPDLDELVEQARESGERTFEPSDNPEACDCWMWWDPECGRPGCWGVPAR